MNKNPLNLTTKIIIFHCLKFQPVLEAKRCYKNKVIKGVLIAIYLVLWFESYEWLVGIDRLSFFFIPMRLASSHRGKRNKICPYSSQWTYSDFISN